MFDGSINTEFLLPKPRFLWAQTYHGKSEVQYSSWFKTTESMPICPLWFGAYKDCVYVLTVIYKCSLKHIAFPCSCYYVFILCPSVSLTKKSGFISWHTLAWIWLYRELEFPPWNVGKSNLKDTPFNCAQFKMTVCLLMPGTVKLVYCVIVFNMWNI